MKYLLIGIIKLYQMTLSKLKPPCCRFYPTCSAYGISAVRRFGAVRGGCLTIRRLLRCNPFSAGGYDPVPETFSLSGSHQKIDPLRVPLKTALKRENEIAASYTRKADESGLSPGEET